MELKERSYRFFFGNENFKREYLSELRVLILFTLGFTIAFTWRQTTFDSTERLVQLFVTISNSATLSIVTSTVITFFCLLVIYLTSRLLEE